MGSAVIKSEELSFYGLAGLSGYTDAVDGGDSWN